MTNEEILMPIFKELYNKFLANDFVKDKSGVKIAEIWDCHIQGLNPVQPILEFNGRKSPIDYIIKESKWYNSCSLNIKDYVDDVKIWQQVCDKDGFVNSNYGWCVYSKENYKQYNHVLKELKENPSSRRATMIYNRPSMWVDYNQDGMNEFMCTYAHQFSIRNNRLECVVYMRSNDIVFGFMSDLAWCCEVYNKLYKDLEKVYPELCIGHINWNACSLHIYERHFDMLKKIVGAE